MNWQSRLRIRSRDPEFLWRMVIIIIGAGIILGWVAEQLTGARPVLPEMSDASDWKRIEAFATQGEWWQVWWAIPRQMLTQFSRPGIVSLALFAGACWLVFILQTLRVKSLSDWRLGAVLAGLLAGAISIWPTDFFILWQDHSWQLRESEELVPGLRFFILGVGLREEFAKLVCLLPLMPWLVYKRDSLAALLVSSSVGLGFAIIENLSYYHGSQATATMGRFLTANPYHMALTGLIGLYVYRAIRDPQNWAPPALAMFCLMVVAHGVYDAFSLPALAEYSVGAYVIFALVMYQFFHELRTLRPRGQDPISLTATFLCAVSLLAAATFIYISAVSGSKTAADTLVGDIIGTAVMVYLFLREMPDTLVSV
jgi:RsiW-degrading membrane proteinase PrsW (M82 family)